MADAPASACSHSMHELARLGQPCATSGSRRSSITWRSLAGKCAVHLARVAGRAMRPQLSGRLRRSQVVDRVQVAHTQRQLGCQGVQHGLRQFIAGREADPTRGVHAPVDKDRVPQSARASRSTASDSGTWSQWTVVLTNSRRDIPTTVRPVTRRLADRRRPQRRPTGRTRRPVTGRTCCSRGYSAEKKRCDRCCVR